MLGKKIFQKYKQKKPLTGKKGSSEVGIFLRRGYIL